MKARTKWEQNIHPFNLPAVCDRIQPRVIRNRMHIWEGYPLLDIYDDQIARHYAAYRPPLHQLIINEALENQLFEVGLDIGCGTGCSAIALADRCRQVFGVDIPT